MRKSERSSLMISLTLLVVLSATLAAFMTACSVSNNSNAPSDGSDSQSGDQPSNQPSNQSSSSVQEVENMSANTTLKVSSPAFMHNSMIPKKYTCQGENINPPLNIEGVPSGTQALALVMDDPDAPMGVWDHWILWNIKPTSGINENTIPVGAVQGVNSAGGHNYQSPCPPSGTHRYFFKVYALDMMLNLRDSGHKIDLLNAMKGHVLAQGALIGLYKKS